MLLPVPYSRTKSKQKSVELTLIKGFNWLLQLISISVDFEIMPRKQIKTYLKILNWLYITDRTDFFVLFFQRKRMSHLINFLNENFTV